MDLAGAVVVLVDVHDLAGLGPLERGDDVGGVLGRDGEDRRVHLHARGDAEHRHVRPVERLGHVRRGAVAADEQHEVRVGVDERLDGGDGVGRARLVAGRLAEHLGVEAGVSGGRRAHLAAPREQFRFGSGLEEPGERPSRPLR